MEYVPGLTLRRFCRANRLLPLEQIAEIGFKCAMALGYCCRQGLIHRDVKPANILALMDGERIADVKITDFGSVLNLDSERTQVFRVGSLAYMSPEQLDGADAGCARRHLLPGGHALPPGGGSPTVRRGAAAGAHAADLHRHA